MRMRSCCIAAQLSGILLSDGSLSCVSLINQVVSVRQSAMAQPAKRKVFVIGVGMTKFEKPGSRHDFDYPEMVHEAVTKALADANISYQDVQQATVGYIYGMTCSGQRALYGVGMTGIPIYNVNNACASGSTGLFMAKQLIEGGNCDCVLSCGFEKMQPGSLDSMGQFEDRAIPVDRHVNVIADTFGLEPSPITAQMFGNAGKEHMEKYGTKPEHFAKIAWKNHKHSVNNPNAQFQKEYSLQEILDSKMIHFPLTKLQCSETFLNRHPALKEKAVELVGMVMVTDFPTAFNENSNTKMIGYDMVEAGAKKLFKETGKTPNDVDVIELHDCFSANELITYEAIGLCPPGKAGELIDRGDNTYGGKWVINPSGGLISKGHPIGATGVAQCAELTWQLRGTAGKRQVPNARLALQHNIGIGGAVVLGLYRLAFPSALTKVSSPISSGFASDILFEKMKEAVHKEADRIAGKVSGKFRFTVSGTSGAKKEWLIDLTVKPAFIGQKQEAGKVDCEFALSDADLLSIAEGKMTTEKAFMQGKLKLKGNMAKAMKLKDLLNVKNLQAKL